MRRRKGRALRRRYGRAKARAFTVEPGRNIYRNGEAFISVAREGHTIPATADEATHVLADCLNKKRFRGTYDK